MSAVQDLAHLRDLEAAPAAEVPGGNGELDADSDSSGTEPSSSMASEPAAKEQKDVRGAVIEDPGEVNHVHWYETCTRYRITYYVFLAVAVCLAVSMSRIANMFFSVLTETEIHPRLVATIFFMPFSLIGSAAVVDMMFNLGLDGMASPCLAQWRVTFTMTVRHFYTSFASKWAEWILLALIEGVPLAVAVFSQFNVGHMPVVYRAIRFLNFYLRGAVFLIYILAVTFLICRFYTLSRDAEGRRQMLDLYLRIDFLGLGDSAVDSSVKPEPSCRDRKRPWRVICSLLTVAFLTDVALMVIFIIKQSGSFAILLMGQLVITLLVTGAMKAAVPRLVGRPFWWIFLLFFVLTGGLWLFALQELKSKDLSPLCFGPTSREFNRSLAGVDLPLQFAPPVSGRGYGYPVCGSRWGNPEITKDKEELNILDLAALAFASSYSSRESILANLHETFDGTVLGDWNLTHVEPAEVVGRWIVVDFPESRTRVVAVRGTSTLSDVFADLGVYGGIAVFQFMNMWTPVLQVLGADAIRWISSTDVPQFWKSFLTHMELQKAKSDAEGFSLVVTGHSLGAALTGVAASVSDVQSVGFSAPGLFYRTNQFEVDLTQLERSFTNVQPRGDAVPRVDRQHGAVNWVKCDRSPGTCHRLTKTACELWAQCGDPRGRDFRATCSEWYKQSDLNM